MWSTLLGRARASSTSFLAGTLLALSLGLTACPASLANPEDFADRSEFQETGGAGSDAGTSASAGTASSGTPDCVLAIFKAGSGTCSGSICHDQGMNSAGGLDLASADVAARLVNQVASHADVGPNDVCPMGDKFIDTSNRGQSWLLKKLSASTVGTCGARMPDTGNLSSIQLSCLENWINDVQPGGT